MRERTFHAHANAASRNAGSPGNLMFRLSCRPAVWMAATLAFAVLLIAPALPGAAGGRVLAHAQLVASSPGAGSSLDAPPTELRLVFSEPLEAQLTSLDLADEAGNVVLERAGSIDPDDPFALVVPGSALPELVDGVYLVTWRTLSTVDGHTGEGTFSFGIGSAPSATPAAPGETTHTDARPFDALGRWLTYLGLLLAFGVPATHRVLLGGAPMPRALVRLLAGGLLVSGLATLLVAVGNAIAAGGAIGDYLVGSRTGILHVARAAVALVGAGILAGAGVRPARLTAASIGLAGIGLLVASGHAAALPGPGPILVQGVHVAGAAIWIGGLVVLFGALWHPALVDDGAHRPSMRALVPRFSALALVAIGLVGLTGIATAWSLTGALVDPGTQYGRRLVLKSVVALAAIGLGGLSFLDGGRLRRWVGDMRTRLTAEVGLAALVLTLTASLATTPPVDEAGGVTVAPVPNAFGATTPGIALTLSPGRPGVNRVVVTTTDAMAMIAGGLELVLDRVDTGTSARIPLALATAVIGGHEGGTHDEREIRGSDSPVDWVADAVVLPAGGEWDASVRAVAVDGAELARQRFAFALSEGGVSEGAAGSVADPVTVIAVLLLVGGTVGLGLGVGGWRLPRTDPAASRIALAIGGVTAVALGAAIGLDRLLRL